MKKIRYLFVTTHFEPDFHYGGVVESSVRLYKYLLARAVFRISTVSMCPQNVYNKIGSNGNCYKSIIFHRFATSLDSVFGLWKDVYAADAVLVNGIFTFPVTLSQLYAVFLKKPFIVATRGGLEPWCIAHKKWKKYLYIKWITLPLMRRAKYIHVTSDAEESNIRALGFNNTIKVTNGIDLEMYAELPAKMSYKDYRDDRFIFLFMSRTDKEKGLDILIEAYRRFCNQNPIKDHLLLIVGPDHQGYLKRFNLNYSQENILYIDGVYGEDKIKLIRRSDIVVLPSYSENFGNIVAEALVCERPVITTTGTPWKEIEDVGCGWYIQPDINHLYDAMIKACSVSATELEKMGMKGRSYITNKFSWEAKAKELYVYLEKLI